MKIEDREYGEVVKTLGLLWDPSADDFLFRFQGNFEDPEYHSKRIVLSEIGMNRYQLSWKEHGGDSRMACSR